MIKQAILLFALLFICNTVYAQDISTVQPEKPTLDKPITVAYHPETKKASIKEADSLKLYTLFWPKEGDPVFKSFAMEKNGEIWQAQITPKNPQPVMVQYKFVSGELEDTNNKDFWDIPIYNEEGEPVSNAYFRLGDSWNFMGHYDAGLYYAEMIRSRNIEKANKYYKKAWNSNPDNVDAVKQYLFTLTYQLNDGEKKEQIKKQGLEQTNEFVDQFHDVAEHPKALSIAIYAYSRFGNEERSDSLRTILFDQYYDHEATELQRYYQVFESEDDSTKVIRAQNYITDYPDHEHLGQIRDQLMLPAMVKQNRSREALTWLDKHQPDEPSAYARLADLLIENDSTNTNKTLILQAAQKGYELGKESADDDKPSFATPEEWEKAKDSINNRPKAYWAHILARAYMQNDQYEKARPLAAEAVELRKGVDIPYNATYIRVLLENKEYDKAVKEGRKAVADNKANEELIKDLKKAFMESRAGADFEQFLSEAKTESARQLRDELQDKLIRDKAPAFTMQSLKGDSVSLKQLNGKVVVLDFWATWCGPCISAFPDYQEVVNHFKNNDEVVFWAVNTWNGTLNDERIKNVKEFMKKNKWSFPILLDEDKYVNEYGVKGIPTQFMIGKSGDIRFKQLGYPGASLKQEMIVMINMLLEEETVTSSR